MNGERVFLGDGTATEELDLATTGDDADSRESGNVIGTCRSLGFQSIEVERLIDDLRGATESTELGLTTDERRLASFEAEISALAGARLLTFGTATCSRAGAGAVAARDALALLGRAWIGSKCVEHRCYGKKNRRIHTTDAGGESTGKRDTEQREERSVFVLISI